MEEETPPQLERRLLQLCVTCHIACDAGRPFPSRANGTKGSFAGKPEQWKTKVTSSSPGRFGNEMEEEQRWLSATALHAVGMEKL